LPILTQEENLTCISANVSPEASWALEGVLQIKYRGLPGQRHRSSDSRTSAAQLGSKGSIPVYQASCDHSPISETWMNCSPFPQFDEITPISLTVTKFP